MYFGGDIVELALAIVLLLTWRSGRGYPQVSLRERGTTSA
jgi:hypothetical protein